MTKYLYLFVIILLTFSLLNSGCGETNDLKVMEKRSIKAVHNSYDRRKKFQLVSHLENKPFFRKTLFFRVTNTSIIPSPYYIVAIPKGTKKAYYIFSSYRREDLESNIDKFTKIIAIESYRIEPDIGNYVDTFSSLVTRSCLINSIDDIKYLSDGEKSELIKNVPNIGPPKYEFKGANINIEFYSCSLNDVFKWNLIVSTNGEVMSFKVEEFKARRYNLMIL